MTMKEIRFILVSGLLLLIPSAARAQFQGDVFFAQPSVAVPEGGTAVLEVLLFSGADVVGATHLDILFEPGQAEVVKIEPGAAPELANGLATVTSAGRAALVDLNGSSLEQPFGTVSLARVHIRPLGVAGQRVPLNIEVRSLLRQDSTAFPETNGFSGEILVVSAASAIEAIPAPLLVRSGTDLAKRAWSFRRPGLTVDLLDFETRGREVSAVRRSIVVPDPGMPVETP